ncbi:MAG: hypothetical protein QM736_13870 [Vicinamibacterales bacterium]
MVTRPAVPPYSSTTMAICVCCALELLQQFRNRLLSGTMRRRPQQRRDLGALVGLRGPGP